MKIGNRVFENYTYVMAIINLTPDSFFKDSRATCDDVLFRVERAVKQGAAVVDLGAQSTRPGCVKISENEECDRLLKPLERVLENFDVPVSVDTFYPYCAEAALRAGAHMINDVSGGCYGNMPRLIAKHNASVCIMHNAAEQISGDVFDAVIPFLKSAAEQAVSAGVDRDRILIDGGVGFAKSREQSMQLINGYSRLAEAGYPLLLGASRKSVFGGQPEERLQATLKSTALAAKSGVLFVRVHDVSENVEAIRRAYENH